MKTKALIIAMAVMLSLTACGTTENSENSESDTVQTTEAETTAADESEEVTEPAEEIATEEVTEEVTEEETTEESVAVTEPVEFVAVEGLSENYADLEKRCFAYDGQIFTLGESTLQNLIDSGIPFSESELNNAGNNVNKNYETGSYTVKINDYVSFQLSFMNTTDTNITEAECLLSSVRWYTLYVPNPDYDESMNEEIISNLNDASGHICFSFPLTLTKEQLLENNSETTEEDDYNNVKYKVSSEVYMGKSGYSFSFNKDTNQLKEVNISWLP